MRPFFLLPPIRFGVCQLTGAWIQLAHVGSRRGTGIFHRSWRSHFTRAQCTRPALLPAVRSSASAQHQCGAGTGYVTTAACPDDCPLVDSLSSELTRRGVAWSTARAHRHRESEKAGTRRCGLPGAAGLESCRGRGPPLRPSLHATRDYVLLGFCTPSSRLHLVFVAFFVSTSPLNSRQ